MILDYTDNLFLTPEQVDANANVLSSLKTLTVGLFSLSKIVEQEEKLFKDSLDPKRQHSFLVGLPIPEVKQSFLTCCFDWYALSVHKFVRTVGWLCLEQDKDKFSAYATKVIPNVEMWRNKVAAHFAMVDPKESGKNQDTLAMKEISVMTPLGWEKDRFIVPGFSITTVSTGVPSASGSEMAWSLTHVHEELSKRYWTLPTTPNTARTEDKQ